MIKKSLPLRKKVKVLVVGGGLSSEHEVSLKTSQMIVKNLDAAKYDAELVIIQKDGKWKFGKEKAVDIGAAITKIACVKYDFAFIALHGVLGRMRRSRRFLSGWECPMAARVSWHPRSRWTNR